MPNYKIAAKVVIEVELTIPADNEEHAESMAETVVTEFVTLGEAKTDNVASVEIANITRTNE